MRGLERYLAEQEFFTGFTEAHLTIIAGCAKNVRVDAQHYLFKEGDVSDQFYLIRHGQVALEVTSPGRGTLIIQTLGPGEVVGWSWLVPPYRKQFSAQAMDLTRVLAFDARCLQRKCEEDPQLGYEMLKRFVQVLGQRLQATRLQLLDVYAAHG